MLNCPDLCGNWCAWGVDRGEYSDEYLELLSDEEQGKRSSSYKKGVAKKYGEQYLEKYRKESSYGTAPPKTKKSTHW